jgi:hypothetical protein
MSELRKKIREALDRSLSSRGYDHYPEDQEIYEEGLDDFADDVLKVLEEEGLINGEQ